MGTRFMVTKEAPIHENVKKAIIDATELDTRLVMRPLRNTERVLINPSVQKVLELENELGSDLKFEDIAEEVVGVYPKVMLDGEVEAGAWSCGMVAGLINDTPSCDELIKSIISDANEIISGRLAGMVN
jgi:nitronate monooxygenase